jgi:hypothetical protein
VAPPAKSLNAGDCRRTVDIRRYASERGTFLYENIVFFISSLLIPTESLQSLFFFCRIWHLFIKPQNGDNGDK